MDGIHLLALIRLNIGREFYFKKKGRNLTKPSEVLLPSLKWETRKFAIHWHCVLHVYQRMILSEIIEIMCILTF